MVKRLAIFAVLTFFIGTANAQTTEPITHLVSPMARMEQQKNELSKHSLPLNDRYAVSSVNNVFRDNILLNISYLFGKTKNASDINWDNIRSDFTYEFVLQPGEVFAFHEDVLSEYANKKIFTTNAHFNGAEGFLSDGYLTGDGVCHLASLLHWTAKDAGLKVTAPVNHDFAVIPDVPREYGTSIYYMPGDTAVNQQQNLYIENTHEKPVSFKFHYEKDVLTVSISQQE